MPLVLLWMLSYYGGTSFVLPAWASLAVVVLPYLYGLVLLSYLGLYYFFRHSKGKWLPGLLSGLLVITMVVLWGGGIMPSTEQASDRQSLRVMVWNVQRMGEFSKTPGQQRACITQVINKVEPDILALLEITSHQLSNLQQALGISSRSCKWVDYYGTGKRRYGGLAACIMQSSLHAKLSILQQRRLDLPPGWKYLFVEVQPEASVSPLPINFMALHVAPPKITTKRVATILADITNGNAQGFSGLSRLLADYEKQVVLQGSQVSTALAAIKTFKDPTIVVGDFNSTRDSAIHRELRKTLNDTWSEAGWGFGASRYWGGFLPLRIDYIYASKEFSVQSSETIPSDCSDHLPVVSEVFLGPDVVR